MPSSTISDGIWFIGFLLALQIWAAPPSNEWFGAGDSFGVERRPKAEKSAVRARFYVAKNTSVRVSMLSRGAASGALLGLSNPVCAVSYYSLGMQGFRALPSHAISPNHVAI